MNSDTLIFIWILVYPIGIIEVSTLRKRSFLIYFSSLKDYWIPSTWNPLLNTSWCEKERCEKRAFQLLKMRKIISRNIKTKCLTDFYGQIGLRVWRIILVITVWAQLRQTFILISIKKIRILKFFLQLNGYLNTK